MAGKVAVCQIEQALCGLRRARDTACNPAGSPLGPLEASVLPADLQGQDTCHRCFDRLSPLSQREREQKDPFYSASAAEPFGDTVDAHLCARCVLVATRRTGDPNGTDDLLASHDW